MKNDNQKQRIRFHFRFHDLLVWPLIIIIFCSAGCSFKKLKKDLQERQKMVEISGIVASESSTHAPILLLLLTSDPMQLRVVLYRVLAKPGKFNFIVTPGTYQLFAYEDLNRDQKHQDNERIGRSEQIKVTSPGAKFSELTILIPDKTDPELLRDVDDIKSKGQVDLVNSKRHTGKIISLDEPFLDKKFVTMGLWQPLKFINEVPFGIFFMEEFRSDKIPVLFIHGINGSPRFFKEIITNLDHDKFQAWLAYYPSGARLDRVAEYLYNLLSGLHLRYDFKKVQIVAHSMGGLITRALVNLYDEENCHFKIDRIVTISTPFAGHGAAAMGLKYAPTVIPAWNDVVPGSVFIRTLFQKPLPQETSLYLLFSFEGKSRFAEGNSDGVVSIASELRPEAQNEAVLVRGFAENHTSILENDQAITLLNQILDHEH